MNRKTCVFLLCALLGPTFAFAQQELDAQRIHLGPAGATCLVSSGTSDPSGATTCDFYVNRTSGQWWEKLVTVGWMKVGTVTSVGNGTIGALFSASWATGTTTPALSIDLASQAANKVLASPNGSSGVPTARTLVNADLPTVDTSHGGCNTTSLTTNGVLYGGSTCGVTAQGGTNTVLVANGGAPSFSTNITVGTATTTGNATVGATLSVNNTITTPSATDLRLFPTGSLLTDPASKIVESTLNYDVNLGQLSRKFLTLHAAELWVETLVAQQTLSTVGGRILVLPTNQLVQDAATGDTTLHFKYNNLASGDRIYFEANGSVEFMAVTSSASGSAGNYAYTVTRNLDGTGANQWYAGDAAADTGQTGSGFLDLYSIRGTKAASEAGPAVVCNVRNSATYNDWSPRCAFGNLNGLYGYGSDTYGFAAGDNAASWIKVDPTNGLRIGNNTTTFAQITAAGAASFSGSVTVTGGNAAKTDFSNVSAHYAGSGSTGGSANDTALVNGVAAATVQGGAARANLGLDGSGVLVSTLPANSVNTTQIVGGAITTATISANAVTAAKIAAGTITANEIAAGAITASKISVTSLDAITANLGTITSFSLTNGSGADTCGFRSGQTGTGIVLWCGDATPTSAPFRMQANGGMIVASIAVTSAADISQNLVDFTNVNANISATDLSGGVCCHGYITAAHTVQGGSLVSTGTAHIANALWAQGINSHPGTNSTAAGSLINLNWTGSCVELWVDALFNAGCITTSSDKRIKQNIAPIASGLSAVLALQPIQFNRRQTGPDGTVGTIDVSKTHYGLVAQDVAATSLGSLATHSPMKTDLTPDGLWTLNYVELVPVLVQAIKDLQDEINALKPQHGN